MMVMMMSDDVTSGSLATSSCTPREAWSALSLVIITRTYNNAVLCSVVFVNHHWKLNVVIVSDVRTAT